MIAALIDADPDYDPDAVARGAPEDGSLRRADLPGHRPAALGGGHAGDHGPPAGPLWRAPALPGGAAGRRSQDIRAVKLSHRKVRPCATSPSGSSTAGSTRPSPRAPRRGTWWRPHRGLGGRRWTAEGFLAIALHRDDVVLPGDPPSTCIGDQISEPTPPTTSPVSPRYWPSPRGGAPPPQPGRGTTSSRPCTAPEAAWAPPRATRRGGGGAARVRPAQPRGDQGAEHRQRDPAAPVRPAGPGRRRSGPCPGCRGRPRCP